MTTMADLHARHRKELKALEGEKRAAIKKTKATTGKKGKDLVAAMEAEYDEKLRVLQEKHKVELHAASTSDAMTTTTNEHVTTSAASKEHDTTANRSSSSNSKLDKTRKKREKDRDQKREREQRIAEETANAISPRQVEMEQIQQQLEGLHLMIHEVAADGNCLYRAVGAQCGADYVQMRKACADMLVESETEFAPFCELTDDVPDFRTYVERVRSSAEWGGHLELRALALALKRQVVVYSSTQAPLIIEEHGCDSANPIRLSYHLTYYALGEHYNQVAPAAQLGDEEIDQALKSW